MAEEPDTYRLIWRGQEVGTFTSSSTDMWYVDGPWVSSGTPKATEFSDFCSGLVFREVYDDPSLGTRVHLLDPSGETIDALVLGLEGPVLSLRLTMGSEAIAWLRANVS